MSQNQDSCPHPYPLQTLEALGVSNTGNIYGVYDMNGGVWEYMIGQIVQDGTELGTFYSNSSSGTWNEVPELKYYDSYSYDTSYDSYGRGHLGDAKKETLNIFGKGGKDGWYADRSAFPITIYIWFLRGGGAHDGSDAGTFAFDRGTGSPSSQYGFRSVLVIE